MFNHLDIEKNSYDTAHFSFLFEISPSDQHFEPGQLKFITCTWFTHLNDLPMLTFEISSIADFRVILFYFILPFEISSITDFRLIHFFLFCWAYNKMLHYHAPL